MPTYGFCFGVAFSEFVQQGLLILFWLSLISLENFHKWISFRYVFVNTSQTTMECALFILTICHFVQTGLM